MYYTFSQGNEPTLYAVLCKLEDDFFDAVVDFVSSDDSFINKNNLTIDRGEYYYNSPIDKFRVMPHYFEKVYAVNIDRRPDIDYITVFCLPEWKGYHEKF